MLEDVKKCHTTTSAMLFISEMVNLLMEKQDIWGIAQTKDREWVIIYHNADQEINPADLITMLLTVTWTIIFPILHPNGIQRQLIIKCILITFS